MRELQETAALRQAIRLERRRGVAEGYAERKREAGRAAARDSLLTLRRQEEGRLAAEANAAAQASKAARSRLFASAAAEITELQLADAAGAIQRRWSFHTRARREETRDGDGWSAKLDAACPIQRRPHSCCAAFAALRPRARARLAGSLSASRRYTACGAPVPTTPRPGAHSGRRPRATAPECDANTGELAE